MDHLQKLGDVVDWGQAVHLGFAADHLVYPPDILGLHRGLRLHKMAVVRLRPAVSETFHSLSDCLGNSEVAAHVAKSSDEGVLLVWH